MTTKKNFIMLILHRAFVWQLLFFWHIYLRIDLLRMHGYALIHDLFVTILWVFMGYGAMREVYKSLFCWDIAFCFALEWVCWLLVYGYASKRRHGRIRCFFMHSFRFDNDFLKTDLGLDMSLRALKNRFQDGHDRFSMARLYRDI